MATTFDMDVSTGTFTTISIKNGHIWTGLAIALAIILAFYVLRSIGLFVLAKRQNIKHAFLAWIPLVWFYIFCKLIGKSRIFNMPYEKVAVWLCVIFAVSELLVIVISFLSYFPLFQYPCDGFTKIFFDLPLPDEMQDKQEHLKSLINTKINELGIGNYQAEITFDSMSFN